MNPTEIHLNRDRTRLSVTWESGATSVYAAVFLRQRARDAGSVRSAVDVGKVTAAPDLTITEVEPIGNYAVRLAFSDGHHRGIYPWAYLVEIDGAGPAGAAPETHTAAGQGA